MPSKVAYVDYVEKIKGISTSIRIFETETHLFIYVNQPHVEIHLYNEYLKKILVKQCKRARRKQLDVTCNLDNYNCIDEIGKQVSKIIDGDMNRT